MATIVGQDTGKVLDTSVAANEAAGDINPAVITPLPTETRTIIPTGTKISIETKVECHVSRKENGYIEISCDPIRIVSPEIDTRRGVYERFQSNPPTWGSDQRRAEDMRPYLGVGLRTPLVDASKTEEKE